MRCAQGRAAFANPRRGVWTGSMETAEPVNGGEDFPQLLAAARRAARLGGAAARARAASTKRCECRCFGDGTARPRVQEKAAMRACLFCNDRQKS
jgi:hypothetical protein